MLLVNSGRVLIVENLKDLTFHVGLGRGLPSWDAVYVDETKTFDAGNQLVLNHDNPINVVVTSNDGLTTYVNGTDYTVVKSTKTIQRITNGSIPAEATVKIDYTSERPDVTAEDTTLLDPVGYRKMKATYYLTPDEAGEISLPSGLYSISVDPTKYLYVETELDFADGAGEEIREFGLFANTTYVGSPPGGQMWYEAAEVDDPGNLVMKAHLGVFTLSGIVKEKFPHLLVI